MPLPTGPANRCHALGCNAVIPQEAEMCYPEHWPLVARERRQAVVRRAVQARVTEEKRTKERKQV